MTRPLDDDLRELLTRRATVERRDVEILRAFAATLPPRRRQARGLLAAAAGIVLLLSIGGFLATRIPFGTSGAAPQAPNPAAFAGDPRLAICGVRSEDAEAIFEVAHLRDYPLHLPAAYELKGLAGDPDAPALVIVRRGPGSPDRLGSPAPQGSHDLCIVVGSGPRSWTSIAVAGVDTTGLLAYLPEPTGTPIAADLVPWAQRCGADIEGAAILAVVRVDHGTGISSRLVLDPAPPELTTAEPAAVVVYNTTHPFPPLGNPPAAGATIGPRDPLAEGRHDICVLVGGDPATADRTLHENVAVRFVGSDGSSPVPSATPGPSASLAPTATLPAQIDPAACARLKFAEERCLAVVMAGLGQAGLTLADVASISLAEVPPDTTRLGGGHIVARVTWHLPDGSSGSWEVGCAGIGGQYSLVCTDSPEVILIAPYGAGGGYHDIPCGAIPGGEPGSQCATPMPAIVPDAAASAVRLEIPSRDYPLTSLGPQEVLVGRATLPNGILSDARFSLADPFTRAFTVRDGIALVVRSLEPGRPPLVNLYEHGWYPGTEEVEVYLVLDVIALKPGAALEVRALVVR